MAQQFGSVDTSYFTSNIALGGRNGNDFNAGADIPKSATAIRSLQVWYDDNVIRGVVVVFSDDTTTSRGTTDGVKSTDVFYLAPGEKLTDLQLWKGNDRFGGIELRTDQNRSFSIKVGNIGEPYRPEIGSGLLIGIFGNSGRYLDFLWLAFLRRVVKAQLFEVNYPNLDKNKIKTKPTEIKSIEYDNDLEKEQSFQFTGETSVTTSQSWSVTGSIEVGVSAEVSAGFPILAEGKVSTSLTVSASSTYQRDNTETNTKSYQFPITVPANTKVRATVTLYEGDIKVDYEANMKYVLDSGKEFEYHVKGIYNGVAVSEAVVSVNQIPDN